MICLIFREDSNLTEWLINLSVNTTGMSVANFDEIKENIWKSFPVLETLRLILREICISDRDRLFEIWGNPQVNKYTDFPGLDDLEVVDKFINGLKKGFETKNGIRWAISLKENDFLIGTMGFNR